LKVDDPAADVAQIRWSELADNLREALGGRLGGLWGAISDEEAFNSLAVDKQQALLLIHHRMNEKGLWEFVERIDNVYGIGGVGIEFTPAAVLESTLANRKDFTRRLARHRNTSGGFYEKGQAEATLHFLYVEHNPPKWYVHFDLYSPVHSAGSAFKHFHAEYVRRIKPNWRLIKQRLKG
jgi:hypothetical protein